MIRMELRIELDYEVEAQGADFILNVQAAYTPSQTVIVESMTVNQPIAQRVHTDPASGNRYLYVHALPGELKLVLHGDGGSRASLRRTGRDRRGARV